MVNIPFQHFTSTSGCVLGISFPEACSWTVYLVSEELGFSRNSMKKVIVGISDKKYKISQKTTPKKYLNTITEDNINNKVLKLMEQ